jgi:ABC-type polysaccharide/polyol phosphate transport system ATPase subunit
MASLIQITRAVKSYGDQVLLDGAEATLSDNVKVGFIGRNGAGKSTTAARSSAIRTCGSAICGNTIPFCRRRLLSSS